MSLVRRDPATERVVVAVANFTPTPRTGYRIGVPRPGGWRERLNSDAAVYGGSNAGNGGRLDAEPVAQPRPSAVAGARRSHRLDFSCSNPRPTRRPRAP